MVKVILGPFGEFSVIDNRISRKRLIVEQKQVTFDASMLKVILGSFSLFLIFAKPVSQKWLVIERNGVKFELQR